MAPLLLLIPVATLGSWWEGHGYGPRLLADSTPILYLLLCPAFEQIQQRVWLKHFVVGLAALSIGMRAIGFATTAYWDVDLIDSDTHPELVWSWRESPPILYGTQLCMQMWQNLSALL